MINTLQSLRGVFAVMVFLSHFAINQAGDRVFYNGGPMAVEYFIVLSGFVLCAGYEKSIDRKRISYKDFILKRLIRIYPLHLVCLLLWIIVNFQHTDYLASVIIPNLFLIQAWFPDMNIFYGCNTPSWCLSALLFCYLMFPLLIRFYESKPKMFVAVWGVLMMFYVDFLARGCDGSDGLQELWLTRVIPSTRLLDFMLGMLLWQLFSSVRQRKFTDRLRSLSYGAKTLLECLPVALYIIATCFASGLSVPWLSQSVWWLPTIVCILTFSLLDKAGGALSRLFDSRALLVFGNASFCFYLLHMPVVAGLRRGLIFLGYDPGYYPLFVISLVTGIAVSVAYSRYIDVPVGRCLKARLIKSR